MKDDQRDDYAVFLAWAKPFVWSGDKAAMDLAWMSFRAALAQAQRPAPDIGDLRDVRDTFGGETDCQPPKSTAPSYGSA